MSADFSLDRTYRYTLRRELAPRLALAPSQESRILFVCLNPSTADETVDDQTIRQITGYARRWGYTHLTVCNLFAVRATDPAELGRVRDPVGPENDRWLELEARRAHLIVAAWGAHGTLYGRASSVLALLRRAGPKGHVYCLGTTKSGEPWHPLYRSARLEPIPLR